MVDPTDVTDFDRSPAELQEFLMFGMCVAGKTAHIQARKLDEFLRLDVEPFLYVRLLGDDLELALREVRMGKYSTLGPGFRQLSAWDPDLSSASAKALQKVTGIGPKTAKFFIMHSRDEPGHAVLDTHILDWLSELGHDVPNATPTGAEYDRLERVFLAEASKRGRHPAELDLAVWKERSRSKTAL